MQIVNFPVATVTNTISPIVTADQANDAIAAGLEYVAINPSIAIALVDPSGGQNWSNVTGSTAGSVANSPFVCAAGVVTMVAHKGGPISGISTGADSTVKWAFAVNQ